MVKAATGKFLLALVHLLTAGNAFHSTQIARPLAKKSIFSPPKADICTSHWSPISTELGNKKALWKTAQPTTSSSLYSFQIRSIFRSSSEAADAATTTDAPRGATLTTRNDLRIASVQASSRALRKLKDASQSISNIQLSQRFDQLLQFILQYWWSIPIFLALVPIYTTFVLGIGDAAMPHWWPVTRMDHILNAPDAAMVLGVFLGSNVAFFLSGAYLVQQFSCVPATEELTQSSQMVANNAISATLMNVKSRLQTLPLIPTRQTWLGLLLLISGLISTIFHTEQALGSFAVANSLCYLDHAVAGTSTFYFFHTCGRPSKRVRILMMAGLAALSFVPPHPLPGYAWLHSAWHFIAAGAAVLWAVESHGQVNSSSSLEETPMVQAIPATEDK